MGSVGMVAEGWIIVTISRLLRKAANRNIGSGVPGSFLCSGFFPSGDELVKLLDPSKSLMRVVQENRKWIGY